MQVLESKVAKYNKLISFSFAFIVLLVSSLVLNYRVQSSDLRAQNLEQITDAHIHIHTSRYPHLSFPILQPSYFQFPISQLSEDECIFCAQVVPECGLNEKLVLQTCKRCAHCEPITNINDKLNCLVPCSKNCCSENEECITIDPCKGKKLICFRKKKYRCQFRD